MERASLMYSIQQGASLKQAGERKSDGEPKVVVPKEQEPREWKFKNKQINTAEIKVDDNGVPLPPPPPPPMSEDNNATPPPPPNYMAPPPPPIPASKKTASKPASASNEIPPPPPLGGTPPKRSNVPVAAPKVVKKPFEMKKGNYKNDAWHTIKAFKRSESGSAGVFFVNREDGTTVIKSSSNCPKEYLASVLASRLGFAVPEMRVIDYNYPEWGSLKSNIFAYAKKNCDTGDLVKVGKELDRAYMVAMEAIVGKPIISFTHAELDVLINVANKKHESEVTTARQVLRDIGKVVAIDLYFNQWDRMPIVWDNEGNFDNILIEPQGKGFRVVAIDNSVTSLHLPVPLEKFIKSVHDCLTRITTQPQQVFSGFARFVEMFLAFTGYKITDESVLQMQFGVLEGLLSIVKAVNEDMLTAFKQEMHDIVPKHADWANDKRLTMTGQVWFDGIKEVSVPFLVKMHEEFKLHQTLAEQVLKENPIECKMIYNAGVDTSKLQYKNAKLLVMQRAKYSSLNAAEEALDEIIANDPSGRYPDFIIFPEFWIAENGIPTHNHAVNRFKAVSKKYDCYIVLGTLAEILDSPRSMHITAPIISPQGELIGAYRKRKPTGLEVTPGKEIFAMDTKFGRVTVMICFDIENADIFDENMAQKPFLMLNPVYIPAPAMTNDVRSIGFGWRNAVDVMRRKFEALAGTHRFTIVRCDQPFSDKTQSFGTSQVIGPYASVTSPTANETHFFAFVDVDSSNWFTAVEPTVHRTAPEDNTGNRYCIFSLRSPSPIVSVKQLAKKHVILSVKTDAGVSHRLWNGRDFNFEHTTELAITQNNGLVYTKDNEVYICGDGTLEKYAVDLQASTDKLEWRSNDVKATIIDCVTVLDSLIVATDTQIHTLHKSNGQVVGQVTLPSSAKFVQLISLGNSTLLAVQQNALNLLQVDGGALKVVHSLEVHSQVRHAIYSNGKLLVQSVDGELSLFSVLDETISARGSVAGPANIHVSYFAADNRVLGYAGSEMYLMTLNEDSLKIDHTFNSHLRPIKHLDYDGFNVVTYEENELKFWEFTQNNHKVGLSKML